jgi:hypothetical protein
MLSTKILSELKKAGLRDYSHTSTFVHNPTTKFQPNMARDLTGFVDGTRNPDHLLRALVDETIIFPKDDEGRHIGGSYMYSGRFIHNLEKFHGLSTEEKSQIIGRKYDETSQHKGYDYRAENPRLDEVDYRSKVVRDGEPVQSRFHTNRSHGSMYRQSMPYINDKEQGLYFICFSRALSEIDNALKRMSGHFATDGSTDALFEITHAVTSNYYYCPSIEELENLRNYPVLDVVINEEEMIVDHKDKVKIIAEYCTNCGYFTIYQKAKEIISNFYPKIEFIENPKNPRLAAFELTTEDGFLLFSKIALPDGMNNYPHCFPTSAALKCKIAEYLKLEAPILTEDDKKPIVWGLTDWQDMMDYIEE